MVKRIIFIKNSACNQVRVMKFNLVLKEEGYITEFVGWKRIAEEDKNEFGTYHQVKYLLNGGGYGSMKLALYYMLWVFKLTFFILRFRKPEEVKFIVSDFDAALPVYIGSLVRPNIKYFYNIHDDFALRYRWPKFIKKLITRIDYKIKSKAVKTIHVDENRIRERDKNFIIIKNTPIDFYDSFYTPSYEPTLAAVGHLSAIRGLQQILNFAEQYPNIKLIIAGKQVFSKAVEKKIVDLDNVQMYPRMPQEQLFDLIKNCSGIYSLYDPSIEINVRAASNKLYDAMMLGIPVIVNQEIVASKMVTEHEIGFLVNYNYDDSWAKLANDLLDKNKVQRLGRNGRTQYETSYNFRTQIKTRLLPVLEE